MRLSLFAAGVAALAIGLPAHAQGTDDDFELWLNPSVAWSLDDDTGLEIETAQRFRDAGEGRPDTYFLRGWIDQSLSDIVSVQGGAERRINDGGSDETRFLQQVQSRHGILRTRVRLEQRLVDDADRLGLRLRPRLGVNVPIDKGGRWAFEADAELFVTLRGNNRGSDEGLTGMRTQIGVSYELTDNISLDLAYLRDQDFEDGPDEVGHAPIIGIGYEF